jgi:hypothetical protein
MLDESIWIVNTKRTECHLNPTFADLNPTAAKSRKADLGALIIYSTIGAFSLPVEIEVHDSASLSEMCSGF